MEALPPKVEVIYLYINTVVWRTMSLEQSVQISESHERTTTTVQV